MKWLLEPDVFKGELQPFVDALDRMGIPYQACKFGQSYESCLHEFMQSPNGTSYFQISLQFAKIIKESRNLKGMFCNLPKLDCAYYYPRFGKNLLNCQYVMMPFGDLHRNYQFLSTAFDSSVIFIRPTSMNKAFTGKVVNNETFDREVKLLSLRMNPEDMILAAPCIPGGLSREWRLIVVNGEVVAGSQNKQNGKDVRIPGIPDDVLNYANKILKEVKYNPDPAWTLDICEFMFMKEAHLRVLEVGAFSCSGLYAADPEAIIKSLQIFG